MKAADISACGPSGKAPHYPAIDGLRGLAAFGIVAMHVAANGTFDIGGYFWDNVLPSLSGLVCLFMAISAFGLCSGYARGILAGEIDLERFYIRGAGPRSSPFSPFSSLSTSRWSPPSRMPGRRSRT